METVIFTMIVAILLIVAFMYSNLLEIRMNQSLDPTVLVYESIYGYWYIHLR